MNLNDTIVAVATPQGRGAIGIVRLSGPESITILSSVFVPVRNTGEYSSGYPSHRLIRGDIHNDGKIIDDVLIAKMDKGKSYTGQDLVEIHAHSNPLILNEILKLSVSRGERLAEPGEFTFRAYMNGRMDLSQAEAVNDVIHAESLSAIGVAQKHLKGEFSNKIKNLRLSLVEMLVHTEASIDFST